MPISKVLLNELPLNAEEHERTKDGLEWMFPK